MSLTAAQLATLKAAIIADGTANAIPNTSSSGDVLAAYLNTVPVSPLSVWRSDVSPSEIAAAVTMSAFVLLTAVKQNGLLLLTQGPVNATNLNVRTAFSDIFGAGATLTALTALAQRPATRFEAIFAAGGPPATSTVYGQSVSGQDCFMARNS